MVISGRRTELSMVSRTVNNASIYSIVCKLKIGFNKRFACLVFSVVMNDTFTPDLSRIISWYAMRHATVL